MKPSVVHIDQTRTAMLEKSSALAERVSIDRLSFVGLFACLLVSVLVAGVYFYFATVGSFRFLADDPSQVSYAMLADAFAHGQASLRVEPSPELLALPDPYDTEAHSKLSLVDASFYHGKYYLYFGPVPAIPRMIVAAITSTQPPTGVMTFAYGLVVFLCGGVLFRKLQFLLGLRISQALFCLVLLAIGLGGIGPYMQSRPGIYHEAILAGMAWLMLGLVLLRIDDPKTSSAIGTFFAGACVALAVGSRISLLPYAACLSIAMLVVHRRKLMAFLTFVLPILAMGAALAFYNQQRFGSPLEFGGRFQLTGMLGATQRFDLQCLPMNLSAYFGHVPRFTAFYPFLISADEYRFDPPRWILEGNFGSILLFVPALIALPFGWAQVLSGRKRGSILLPVAISLGSLATMSLLFCLGWAAMRYAFDFLPLVTLIAFAGFLGGSHLGYPRKLAFLALALASIGFSVSLAVAESNSRFPARTLINAFAYDQYSRSAILKLAPSRWPAMYLERTHRALGDAYWEEKDNRPNAIFTVEGHTLDLTAGDAAGFGNIDFESLFDHDIRVIVELNGTPLEPVTVPPGWQSITVPGVEVVKPGDVARIKLIFPEEPKQMDGSLWPIVIRGL